MSTIFPGNYVAHLNAYHNQGVYALPGIEFYQLRGAAVLSADTNGTDALEVMILSPDLRQDDKPRQNKPMFVPADAVVYRTAISTQNISSAGTANLTVHGAATSAVGAVLTAKDGVFPPEGAVSDFLFTATLTAESGDAPIVVTPTHALTIDNPDDQAAVIVEVCYFIPGEAPQADDIHLPYKTEAGSGY